MKQSPCVAASMQYWIAYLRISKVYYSSTLPTWLCLTVHFVTTKVHMNKMTVKITITTMTMPIMITTTRTSDWFAAPFSVQARCRSRCWWCMWMPWEANCASPFWCPGSCWLSFAELLPQCGYHTGQASQTDLVRYYKFGQFCLECVAWVVSFVKNKSVLCGHCSVAIMLDRRHRQTWLGYANLYISVFSMTWRHYN